MAKIKITRFTYKSGPNKNKKVITRHVSKDGGSYSVQVVKTMGAKTFSVSWCSTEIISGLNLRDALSIASDIVEKIVTPKIDLMRVVANS